jgi:hypothetical protein
MQSGECRRCVSRGHGRLGHGLGGGGGRALGFTTVSRPRVVSKCVLMVAVSRVGQEVGQLLPGQL